MAWLTPRLEETDSWDRVLPLRARQRLGFARLLLHRPAWVFLEEATSAFDPEKEGCMTDLLYRELPGTTIITISFHEGLEHRFTRKLVLARLAEEKFLACDEFLPCALRET